LIELIPFGAVQMSPDASLEYPQRVFGTENKYSLLSIFKPSVWIQGVKK